MSSTNSVSTTTTSPSNTGNTSPPSTRDSHPSTTPSSNTTTTTTPSTDSTPSTTNSNSTSESYPEQHHAGAVGYGPNYRQGPSLTDKLTGLKEELKGKVTKNPGLVEHGKEMKSGEMKKREQEEDMNNLDPFGTADDEEEKKKDDDSSAKSPDLDATNSTTTQPNTSSAFGTSNTSTPPQPAYPAETHPTGPTATRDAQGQQINSDGAGVSSAPASTTESGSGMAKPRDVKYIDEDGSGEHHHHHNHHQHHHNSNNYNNSSNDYEGNGNAVASEPGDIARDSVHM
ncbi:hypothetical protein F5051DRAFT_159316 [Lentinula edodes]|nr:hypothetical protein F5051DRAFT_159316 [Lentinula edodes]